MGPQAPSDGGVVNDDVIEGMISRVHQRVVMLLLRADAASARRPNHSEGNNAEQQHRKLTK